MNLQNKSKEELLFICEAVSALERKYKYNKILRYYPDTGPHSRDAYPKHMELMRAGKVSKIRAFVGANGTGKSLWNSIESYFHLSGKYPDWWEGHRFNTKINAWMCARESKALRDGIQEILFGGIGADDIGTGIIPREDICDDKGIIQTWAMAGTANCIGQCLVRHYDEDGQFDGWSKVEFKTYAQGWAEFQGSTRQWITLDEEPDDVQIYVECITRLRPKDGGDPGHLLATFTPTHGFSATYLAFVPDGNFPDGGRHPNNPNKYTVQVTWEDVPHLPEDWRKSQIEEYKIADPMNIDARTKGIAAMGSGRIYPIHEESVIVAPFKIPAFWPKAYGLDPSWSRTAAVWGAIDPDTRIIYIYSEYVRGGVIDLIHADAIKGRGEWIPGAIDPHGGKHRRDDGTDKMTYFQSLGLELVEGNGEPLTMLSVILGMCESGKLRIFNTCQELIKEIRTYRWDSKNPNRIADKQKDDLCDAMRYLISKIEEIAIPYTQIEEEMFKNEHETINNEEGRSSITGY